MIKKLYPHWLRAIHVREDMVWITIKNAPGGAWENILTAAGAGLLLGSPRDGWLRAAVSASDAEQIAKMCEVSALPDIRVLEIYGTDMREMGLPILRTLPMLALVGVFITGNSVYRDRDFHTYNTELEDIAEILVEEAAYEGYATFWNGNVLTEITSGELEAYVVEEWEYGTMNEWLQRKDHLDRTPWGRVFALYRAQDWREGEPGYDNEKLVYASDSFYVVVYDSDEEYREAIGWY